MKWYRNIPGLQLWGMKRPAQKCNITQKRKGILMNIDINPMELAKWLDTWSQSGCLGFD